MKFLKFTYTSCIAGLSACALNIILILLPQNLSPDAQKHVRLGQGILSLIILLTILLKGFAFPYALRLWKEKKIYIILSYFFIAQFLWIVLFRPLSHEMVPDLLMNVVAMIIGFYICFSIKAPPIVRIIRIYAIIGAIIAVPAFILKFSPYHTLFLVYDLVVCMLSIIFGLLWLRLAIRWFEDEKVMHTSLKEIQSIA
jgi:hypothetical protein